LLHLLPNLILNLLPLQLLVRNMKLQFPTILVLVAYLPVIDRNHSV
jgi:hypothetical protein